MLTQTETRNCLACNKALKGRADKKFCDDYCRNGFNNQLKAGTNNRVRNINNTLRRNRRILEELLAEKEKMRKVNRDLFLQTGFHLKYITHTYTSAKGKVYHFCYEYGYMNLGNDWVLIVKKDV